MTTPGPTVRRLPDRESLGRAAAADIATEIRGRLARGRRVRMIFAAAPSQQETLDALVAAPDVDWSRVSAFHMDDYLGLDEDAPQRFAVWLRRRLFDRVPFGAVHLLRTDGDPERRCAEYAALLDAVPIDLVCLGIGVNGHLAFNDPPVADFADPAAVKVVELDDVCRQQQVDDGAFATVADVPRRALTLTVPRLLAADRLFAMVPGSAKAAAVYRALTAEPSTACPATALRSHPDVTLYLDADSAARLP